MSIPFNYPAELSELVVKYNGDDYTWAEAINPLNGPIIDPNIFGWDRQYQYYTSDSVLEPGYCYWIYAYQDCRLKRT